MTPNEVAIRFEEAFTVLRLIPDSDLRYLARQEPQAAWPQYVRNVAEAGGYLGDPWGLYSPEQRSKWGVMERASPEQIGRMNETLGWLAWLTDRERKIVVGKAIGMSFRKLRRVVGHSHEQIRKWYIVALCLVANRLVDKIDILA